jgi:2'-5' RNA ligase
VFLAIELTDAVRSALQAAIDDLNPLKDFLRANAPDRVHLTLHFLGHLAIELIDQLRSELPTVAGEHASFQLQAEGVGAFPSFSRPQVLWAGVQGAKLSDLSSLQADLGQQLRRDGIVADDDRFHPHLTLARVRRPIRGPARAQLREWQARWGDTSFGAIPVTQIALMRSELGAGPPRYSKLVTFSLQ